MSVTSLSQSCIALVWLTSSCTHLLTELCSPIWTHPRTIVRILTTERKLIFVCLYLELDTVNKTPPLCSSEGYSKSLHSQPLQNTAPNPSTHSRRHTQQHSHPYVTDSSSLITKTYHLCSKDEQNLKSENSCFIIFLNTVRLTRGGGVGWGWGWRSRMTSGCFGWGFVHGVWWVGQMI